MVKTILLTGDDGYNAIGIKILIDILGKNYQLKIVGTKNQQSGVGGKLNIKKDLQWGQTKVNGVDALWIDGTPVDAVLLAKVYFKKKFDLVISGINLGPNLACGGNITSGTYSAGAMALSLQVAQRGLIMSWDCPPEYWVANKTKSQELQKSFKELTKNAQNVLRLIFKNNFWGCKLLNINFPKGKVKKIAFTRPIPDITKFYSCDPKIDLKKHTYNYSPKTVRKGTTNLNYDGPATQNGYISITPSNTDFLDAPSYAKLKGKKI